MSAVDTKFYDKKKSSTFYIALLFLGIVIIITGGMFYYNMQLQEKNSEILSQTKQLENSIRDIEKDPNVQVYSIYQKHESFLRTLGDGSRIPTFVSHLKKHFAIHGLDAKGFKYSDGIVSVELSAQTNDSGAAYEKIVKFLRTYNELGEDALFIPLFVEGFDGYDRINFTAEFKLK